MPTPRRRDVDFPEMLLNSCGGSSCIASSARGIQRGSLERDSIRPIVSEGADKPEPAPGLGAGAFSNDTPETNGFAAVKKIMSPAEALRGVDDSQALSQLLQAQTEKLSQLLQGQEDLQSAVLGVSQNVSSLLAQPPEIALKSSLSSGWLRTHLEHDKMEENRLETPVTSHVVSGRALKNGATTGSLEEVRGIHSRRISCADLAGLSAKSQFAKKRSVAVMQRVFEMDMITQLSRKSEQTSGNCSSGAMKHAELLLDSLVGVLIVLNALFIGVEMDSGHLAPKAFLIIDTCFSIFYIVEITIKIMLYGPIVHFCKHPSKGWNRMDAALVILDVGQLAGKMIDPTAAAELPSASLFRMLRLVKLTRIVRLLRAAVFQDLLAMIRGMMGGATVVFWAILLFFMIVYVVSLLSREALGCSWPCTSEDPGFYFAQVPRAMFTVFRCAFGDCSSSSGTPIFEHVWSMESAGMFFSFCYTIFVFVVTIGLFNVISASFVESSLAVRDKYEKERLRDRIEDEELWSHGASTLIRRLLELSPDLGRFQSTDGLEWITETGDVVDLTTVEISGSSLDAFIKDDIAIRTLAELDIDKEDNANLSDIFDPGNDGSIAICDLVDGLRRLRGKPKRSDIVAIDLMMRSIQLQINDICDILPQIFKASRDEPPKKRHEEGGDRWSTNAERSSVAHASSAERSGTLSSAIRAPVNGQATNATNATKKQARIDEILTGDYAEGELPSTRP